MALPLAIPAAVAAFSLPGVVQAALAALVASGALWGLLKLIGRLGLKQYPSYVPVVQKGADYLEWAELQGIHLAEIAGLNPAVGPQAKIKLAVDTTLDLLAGMGIEAHGELLTVDKVRADIEAILPKVYPHKK